MALEDGIVDVAYCPTSEMVADILTKPIPRGQFQKLRTLMGIEEIKWECWKLNSDLLPLRNELLVTFGLFSVLLYSLCYCI